MKVTKPFYQISSGIIYVASFLVFAILTIKNLRFITYVRNMEEQVRIRHTDLFMTGIFFAGILLLLYLIFRFAEKINEKTLFIIFSIIYIAAGIYLIMHIDSTLRYDAKDVFNSALKMHNGDFSAMDRGHYIYRYPHQIGFVIYEYIVGFINQDAKLLFAINLAAILVINFFLYKITQELFENQHKINLMVITLSFLFVPQFFFLTFAYGLIPGFCLLMIGIDSFFIAVRTREKKFMIISSIFLMAAVLMKKNFIIGLAACICFLFWKFLKENNKNLLVFIAMLLVVFLSGKTVMTLGFERYTGKEVNQGVPAVLWIAMGTDPHNNRRSGGWYDKKYVDIYKKSHYDREKAAQEGKNMISGYLKYYKKDPSEAFKFFSKKVTTTWTDPMYEALFSGPKEKAGQHVKTKQLYYLFNNLRYGSRLCTVMKAYMILLFAGAGIFVTRYRKECEGAALGLIFMIGGFLFHLFWETKGQYVYPYAFMQIPIAAYVIMKIFEKVTRHPKDQ